MCVSVCGAGTQLASLSPDSAPQRRSASFCTQQQNRAAGKHSPPLTEATGMFTQTESPRSFRAGPILRDRCSPAANGNAAFLLPSANGQPALRRMSHWQGSAACNHATASSSTACRSCCRAAHYTSAWGAREEKVVAAARRRTRPASPAAPRKQQPCSHINPSLFSHTTGKEGQDLSTFKHDGCLEFYKQKIIEVIYDLMQQRSMLSVCI